MEVTATMAAFNGCECGCIQCDHFEQMLLLIHGMRVAFVLKLKFVFIYCGC